MLHLYYYDLSIRISNFTFKTSSSCNTTNLQEHDPFKKLEIYQIPNIMKQLTSPDFHTFFPYRYLNLKITIPTSFGP
jgi:hypothetical protein